MDGDTLSVEERAAMFGRAEFRLYQLEAPVKFAERWPESYVRYNIEPARERANDFRELIRLAKLATPELLALGDAAVAYDTLGVELPTTRAANLHDAARAYAASVSPPSEENNHE